MFMVYPPFFFLPPRRGGCGRVSSWPRLLGSFVHGFLHFPRCWQSAQHRLSLVLSQQKIMQRRGSLLVVIFYNGCEVFELALFCFAVVSEDDVELVEHDFDVGSFFGDRFDDGIVVALVEVLVPDVL